MTFDRRASIRRIRPQRPAQRLLRRQDGDLPFVAEAPVAGRELLLDTTVYVDVLQGKTEAAVDRLLQTRIINHSTVALSELTHLIGALDPANSGTAKVLKPLDETIDDIPGHRLNVPSPRFSAEAGMLAGLVTRLTGQPGTVSLLNDAIIFLQAAEIGCDVLTGNIRDFDWFDQLLPGNGLILYRRLARTD